MTRIKKAIKTIQSFPTELNDNWLIAIYLNGMTIIHEQEIKDSQTKEELKYFLMGYLNLSNSPQELFDIKDDIGQLISYTTYLIDPSQYYVEQDIKEIITIPKDTLDKYNLKECLDISISVPSEYFYKTYDKTTR